jgi:polyvinyl alcohol dehydrogenase (cytochrome)
MRRRLLLIPAMAALMAAVPLVSALPSAAAKQAATCAPAHHKGGDWTSYGHDIRNTRSQPDEHTISASNAGSLTGAWAFSPGDVKGMGDFQSTPVIAQGCVYMTTGSGYVYAINADTGKMVWGGRYAKTVEAVCCGSTLFAPTVHDGVVYINVSRNSETAGIGKGPYVLALDADTGKVIWQSHSVATEHGAYTNSSARYFRGLLFIGISSPEGGKQNIGGFAILDAKTGRIIDRTRTIPTRDLKAGYAGGSMWSTPAIDASTGFAYAGTGQPSSTTQDKQHQHTDAIVKIDLRRGSPTFGEILDAYKGTVDGNGINQQNACKASGGGNGACVWTDVDFGASPTLLKNSRGQTIVADFQKAGTMHAAYADTMEQAWSAILSPAGAPIGNYSSPANDGHHVFGMGTYPGTMFSLDGSDGSYQWASPVVTPIGGNPVAYANGVVYYADGKGFLDAYDSKSGQPLLHRPMSIDAGYPCENVGGGVAIARNTVYAVCGERGVQAPFGPGDYDPGYVIAFRLG